MKAMNHHSITNPIGRMLRTVLLVLWSALGVGMAQAASVVIHPNPNPGQQVKIRPTLNVGFGRGLDLFPYLVQPGTGYAPQTYPRVQVFAGLGTNAQFFARADYNGNIDLYGLHFGIIEGGRGYSDDATVVVDPPHMNDFGNELADPGVDEIVLDDGLYYQNGTITRDLTIRGRGKGRTLISGGLLGSVFQIRGGITVTLKDLTLFDGLAVNGGGLDIEDATVVLERVEIKECRAYGVAGEGGAIWNHGGARLTLIDCDLHDNVASRSGGGISNSGINTSLLPAAANSLNKASGSLESYIGSLVSFRPATSSSIPTAPDANEFDACVNSVESFAAAVGDAFGDIPTLFDSLASERFSPDGWAAVKSPSTRVIQSRIYRNRTGRGIASADTLLIVSNPVIIGTQVLITGGSVPIVGGYTAVETHPNDPRFISFGGGIHNDLGLLVIDNSTVTENRNETHLGSFGGGISSFVGAVHITQSTLARNHADATTVLCSGGAVHSFASLVVAEDSDFEDNRVDAGLFLSSGGAVKNTLLSYSEFHRCTFSNNQSGGGGGIANDFLARAVLTDSTIRSNSVTGLLGANGGGVRNEYGGTITLDRCAIAENRASGKAKGGGLYNQCEQIRTGFESNPIILVSQSHATLRNCTVSGNQIDGDSSFGVPLEALGAGVYNGSFDLGKATIDLQSCTIADNVGRGGIFRRGGGIYSTALSTIKLSFSGNIPGASTITLANTLLSGNVPEDAYNNSFSIGSFIVSHGYNMDSDGTGGTETRLTDTGLSSDAQFKQGAVNLAPLAFNGGRTPTRAFLAGSPGKDVGAPVGVLSLEESPSVDQRGLSRPVGVRRDIGAYESTPPQCVADAYTTLQEIPLVIPDSNGLFANDFGDALRLHSVVEPSSGRVQVNSLGGFTYTPNPGFNGTDQFSYVAVDTNGTNGSPVTVTLTVRSKLDLVAASPTANAMASNPSFPIELTFDEAVSLEGIRGGVRLQTSFRGEIDFNLTVNGNTARLMPRGGALPGEEFTLTLTKALKSATGSPFFPSQTLQFRAGAQKTGEYFVPSAPLASQVFSKVCLVDLDGDRDLDILGSGPTNSVWINEGGRFTTTGQSIACPTRRVEAVQPTKMAVGDLNGDGRPDLVLATIDPTTANSIWFNQGDGRFRRSDQVPVLDTGMDQFGPQYQPTSDVVLADMNGDGALDIIVASANFGTTRNLGIWINDGDGYFTRATLPPNDRLIWLVRAGDFNQDGSIDLLVASLGGHAEIQFNQGDGTFVPGPALFQGASINPFDGIAEAVATDLDKDGDLDLFVTGTKNGAWLLENDGHGTFVGRSMNDSFGSRSTAVADLNNDGEVDFVFAQGFGGNQYLRGGTGVTLARTGIDLGNNQTGVAAGDVDGDGDIDLVFVGEKLQVWLANERPRTGTPPQFSVNEDTLLEYLAPNTLLSVASDADGEPVLAQTLITTEHRGALGGLVLQFGDIFDQLRYENGEYVYSEIGPVKASHGTVTLKTDGTFVYQPETNYYGPDSFTYVVTDGHSDSLPATVHINVIPVIDDPIARADHYPFLKYNLNNVVDAYYFIDVAANVGVLANDSNPDGSAITAVLERAPVHGTVQLQPDGEFHYVGDNRSSTDSFSYRIRRGTYLSPPMEVLLGVRPVETVADYYPSLTGQQVIVASTNGVLANDRNPNLNASAIDSAYALIHAKPAHGTVKLHYTGAFTYTPDAGYTGADSFLYRAATHGVLSTPTRVKIGNTAPVAVDDAGYLSINGGTVRVSAPGVLGNDVDVDGDLGLASTLVAGPAHGVVTLQPDGSFTYDPDPTFRGEDTFTYRVSDGIDTSVGVGTVRIRVATELRILSQTPRANSLGVGATDRVVMEFSRPLLASSLHGRVSAMSSLVGQRAISVTALGNRATLQFQTPLIPGETISINVVAGVEGDGPSQLAESFWYQFKTGVSKGGSTFVRSEVGTFTGAKRAVAPADLDGDGKVDVVVHNSEAPATLYFNNGDGTFTERSEALGLTQWSGMDPQGFLVTDFNGDGKSDLVLIGYEPGPFGFAIVALRIGMNDGVGNFTTVRQLPNPGLLTALAAADFDGNGTVDLLTGSLGIFVVWRNDGAGNFTRDDASSLDLGPLTPRHFAVGDVTGDGHPDVYVTSTQGPNRLLINDGQGRFAVSPQELNNHLAFSAELGDLNGDGALDLLVASTFPRGSQAWLNDGKGNLSPLSQELTPVGTTEIALGDLDGNGSLDLWQANSGPDTIWFNGGNGRFTSSQAIGTLNSAGVVLADFDEDGDLDAFVANSSNGTALNSELWINQSPPLAVNDAYTANGSSPLVIGAAVGLMANDRAGDGGTPSASLVTTPAHGMVAVAADGSFTYTPGVTFLGSDVFTYQLTDTLATSGIARVKIGNQAPVAAADGRFVVATESPYEVAAPGLLGNDSDPDGDDITAELVTPPSKGIVAVQSDGSFRYTAAAGAEGIDTFAYRVRDGFSKSPVAIVTLDLRKTLRLLGSSPSPNALDVRRAANIALQFDRDMDIQSVMGHVRVVGVQSGVHGFAASTSGGVLTLNPDADFVAGEMVRVTLTQGLAGARGEWLEKAILFDFVAEAPAGLGVFVESAQRIGDANYNSGGVAAGDLDGDGDIDLFIPNGATAFGPGAVPYGARVWFNDGQGVFADSGQTLATGNCSNAKLADLDGDGDLDVVARSFTSGIVLQFNDGTGHYVSGTQDFGTQVWSGVIPADVNGDGTQDLIRFSAQNFEIWTNNGMGQFSELSGAASDVNLLTVRLGALSVADLDNDGDLDIVVRQAQVAMPNLVWLNDGKGRYRQTSQTFGSGGSGLAVGDMNGDGFVDIVAPDKNKPWVWLNDGSGQFTAIADVYGSLLSNAVELADVNGDGLIDAIVLQQQDTGNFLDPFVNKSAVYLNDGAGHLTVQTTLFNSWGTNSAGDEIIPTSAASADFNGDGAPDLLISAGFKRFNAIWLNGANLPTPKGVASVTVTDVEAIRPLNGVSLGVGANTLLTVRVSLDSAAKGQFLQQSLTAGGFTGPVGGVYSLGPVTASAAEWALNQLLFVPAQNRVAVGQTEETLLNLVVTDGTRSRTTTAAITTRSINNAPEPLSDEGIGFATLEGVAFRTANVLANDRDADPSDTLIVAGVLTAATKGTVVDHGDGTFSYDPGSHFVSLPRGATATDTFQYILSDANGATATSTVTVRITGQNQRPVANVDTVDLDENAGETVLTPQLLRNDADPDLGDRASLRITAIQTSGTQGTVTLSIDGTVKYTPSSSMPNLAPGDGVLDSFEYTVSDPSGGASTARATLRIQGRNEAPVTVRDTVAIAETASGTDITAVLLSNDWDPDPGQTSGLRVIGVDRAGTIGSLTFVGGRVQYSPNGRFETLSAGAVGVDQFRYQVADPAGATAWNVVTVNVQGINSAPIAANDYPVIELKTSATDITAALLANDTDPDSGGAAMLKPKSVGTASSGTVAVSNGAVLYTPPSGLVLNEGQVSIVTFTYTIEDSGGQVSGPGTVHLFIKGHNSPPTAIPDTVTVSEDDHAIDITAFLVSNDTDPDPGQTQTLQIQSVDSTGIQGTLSLVNGVVRYTPPAGFQSLNDGVVNQQRFQYTIQDTQGASSKADVTLTVVGKNDVPVAQPDAIEVTENAVPIDVTATLLFNDSDTDTGETALLRIIALDTTGTRGSATVSGGVVYYSPNGAFNSLSAGASASDTFRYTVTDPKGATATAVVTVRVTGLDTAPTVVASRSTVTVQYSDAWPSVILSGADADTAGSALTMSTQWRKDSGNFAGGLPGGITLVAATLTGNGRTWTLSGTTPAELGSYVIRVTVADATGLTASTDVTLVVAPEDAVSTYTGATFISTSSTTSSTATVTLSATIRDITAVAGDGAWDATAGDIRAAKVTFINRDNNTILASNLPVGLVSASDIKTGTVTYNWSANIGTLDSQTFTIGVIIQGKYVRNESSEDTVVTVSKPMAGEFVSAGGYLTISQSAGLVPAMVGSRFNFGLRAEFEKASHKPEGDFTFMIRNGKKTFRIQGSTITSIAISGRTATVNGIGMIKDYTSSSAPVILDRNATFQAVVVDNGSSGVTDTLAVTVWNGGGGLWFASKWDGIKTVAQTLTSGNVLVKTSVKTSSALAGAADEAGVTLSITHEPTGSTSVGSDSNPVGAVQRILVVKASPTQDVEYVLERSTDLNDWQSILVGSGSSGEVIFRDPAVEGVQYFYRVREATREAK